MKNFPRKMRKKSERKNPSGKIRVREFHHYFLSILYLMECGLRSNCLRKTDRPCFCDLSTVEKELNNSLIRPFFGRSKLAKFLMRLLIVILNKLVRIITRRNRLVSKIALGDHLVGFFCVTGPIFSLVGGALGYHSSFFILHSFLFHGVRVRGKG